MTRRLLLVEEGGLGGVADYTAELADALAGEGWAVDVATAREHGYPDRPGVRLHRVFPYVRGAGATRWMSRMRLSRLVNGFTHLLAIAPVLALARGADVVHVQGGEWPPLGLVQALALRACGARVVWTPHNTFDRGARSHSRARELTARCAGALVLHAESDLAALPVGLRSRCVVIPHGEYGGLGRGGGGRRDRAEPLAHPARRRRMAVLLFGQLRIDKGVRDLLQAAVEVPDVEVALVGSDAGALAEVASLLEDPGLRGRVSVREGFLPIEQAPDVFAGADVVALPYHRASASGVLMLAYGYGRPVLVYPVGGLPEYVVDGETGWVCSRADPGALAATLIAARDMGPAEWDRRGAQALVRAAEHYSWESVARRTAALYEHGGVA